MIELIRGLHNIRPRHQACAVAIGNFDGVHLGHQALLKKTCEIAKKHQLSSGVITFEPHPAEYFLKENSASRLMRLREKCEAIFAEGIERIFVLQFNASLANLAAEEFMQQILIDKLHIKYLIVGEDFHFGSQRQGDIDLLKKSNAFETVIVPSILLEGQRVSSSRVRATLASADHALVERLLGRPYTITGRVVHGNERGRIIGFPTANIYLHRTVTPVQGVYAVRMHNVAASALPGVANVGIRPTIGGTRTLLEVHLFNFNQNIYGRHVTVEFCKKLRDERRFDTIDLLKEQIFRDAEEAEQYFNERL